MTNPNDLIRRGEVEERLELAEHDAEERDWRSGANELARIRKYVNAIPAATVSPEVLALVEAAKAQLLYMDMCNEKGDLERNLRAAIAAWEASRDR